MKLISGRIRSGGWDLRSVEHIFKIFLVHFKMRRVCAQSTKIVAVGEDDFFSRRVVNSAYISVNLT